MKQAFVDLETTNLDADYGHILCGCVKEVGGKIHTFRIDHTPSFKQRPWEDKNLVKQIRDCIEQFDLIYTWYGKRFDKPYVTARLMRYNMRIIKKMYHHDYYYTARFKLKLSRNSQENVARHLHIKDMEKDHVNGEIWEKARCGHAPSMRYIVTHCQKDVRDLERIHGRFKIFQPKSFKKQWV